MNGLVRRRMMASNKKETLITSLTYRDSDFNQFTVETVDTNSKIFTVDDASWMPDSQVSMRMVPISDDLGCINIYNLICNCTKIDDTHVTYNTSYVSDNTARINNTKIVEYTQVKIPLQPTEELCLYRLEIDGYFEDNGYYERITYGNVGFHGECLLGLASRKSIGANNTLYKSSTSIIFSIQKKDSTADVIVHSADSVIRSSESRTPIEVHDTDETLYSIEQRDSLHNIIISRVFGDCTINLYKLN